MSLSGHYWRVISIEVVWLSSIFQACGGGVFIILALHMTIVTELSSSQDRSVPCTYCLTAATYRSSRSRIIYKAFALKYVADLVGPLVSSVALQHSLWLPNLIAIVLLTFSLPFVFLLPETRTKVSSDATSSSAGSGRYVSYRSILKSKNVWICIAITFLTQYRYLQMDVFVPYTSVRYQWTISEVSILDSRLSRLLTLLGVPPLVYCAWH